MASTIKFTNAARFLNSDSIGETYHMMLNFGRSVKDASGAVRYVMTEKRVKKAWAYGMDLMDLAGTVMTISADESEIEFDFRSVRVARCAG
jgi:hypothetical protein